mgnify:CR=1 FL=1
MKCLDYSELGTTIENKYRGACPKIVYPGTETLEWHGFTRHNFELAGCKGFIVEPRNPAPELPWSWCLQWAEAFVPRTPVLKLLDRGFHHVHLDVFHTRMNEEGVGILEQFYAMLQQLHFHPKAALIGMSYGGLFSFRWAAEHPETVAVIYADAPVCDLAFTSGAEAEVNATAYHTTVENLYVHPLAPIHNFQTIAKADIPILAIRNGQDQTVPPESNIDIFAERLQKAGGNIEVLRRNLYGHHPHGLDDPQPLVDFILRHYPSF